MKRASTLVLLFILITSFFASTVLTQTVESQVTPPQTPTLVSPEDGYYFLYDYTYLMFDLMYLDFTWNSSPGTIEYELEIDRFREGYPDLIITTSTTVKSPGLVGARECTWRVRARNEAGYSDWSPTRTFSVLYGSPSPPTLNSPSEGETITLGEDSICTFSWTPSDPDYIPVEHYIIDIVGSTNIVNYNLEETSFSATLTPGEYIWFVYARNQYQDINDHLISPEYQPYRSFSVVDLSSDPQTPEMPILESPEDGFVYLYDWRRQYTGQYAYLEFTWSSSPGATEYEIELKGPEDYLFTTTSTEWYFFENGEYSWRVRARNQAGYSDWTPTRTASMYRGWPSLPTLDSPSEGEIVTLIEDSICTFSWTPSDQDYAATENFEIDIIGPTSITETIEENTFSTILAPGEYTWYVIPNNQHLSPYYDVDYDPFKTKYRSFTATESTQQKPIAALNIDPTVSNLGADVWFYGTDSTDPDGSVAAYYFDFGDEQNSGWLNYPTVAAIHSYSTSGDYYAKLKVKDNEGLESDWSTSIKVTVMGLPKATMPVISPTTGTYSGSQIVSITSTDGIQATIRYTTNNQDPTSLSPVYIDPFILDTSKTIKAIAYVNGMDPSEVATSTITISSMSKIPTPTITPPTGTYSSSQTVTIECDQNPVTIRYTTNGAEPSSTSNLYTSSFSVSKTTTIRAKAYRTGYIESYTSDATITIKQDPPSTQTSAFDPEVDGFSFPNFGTFDITKNELYDAATQSPLLTSFTESEKEMFVQIIYDLYTKTNNAFHISKLWGNCYGMSATAKELFLDPQNPEPDTVWSLTREEISLKIRANQMSSYINPYLVGKIFQLYSGLSNNLEELAEIRGQIETQGVAIILLQNSIWITPEIWTDHAILAYDIEETPNGWVIWAYDSNFIDLNRKPIPRLIEVKDNGAFSYNMYPGLTFHQFAAITSDDTVLDYLLPYLNGLFSVTIHSPANIYVTDSLGRSTGLDPGTGRVVNEIPYALYSGQGSEPQVVMIPNALDNNYNVDVIGTGNGEYILDFETVTSDEKNNQTFAGIIKIGEKHQYSAVLDEQTIRVTSSYTSLDETPPFFYIMAIVIFSTIIGLAAIVYKKKRKC